jgi:2'-5' RNA ligase
MGQASSSNTRGRGARIQISVESPSFAGPSSLRSSARHLCFQDVVDSRRQLSLYLPTDTAHRIEAVRSLVDPVQSRLIPAHITLCREDELTDLPSVLSRLESAPFGPLDLCFGGAEPFGGHGWLLPCIGGEDRFRELREYLLASSRIREQRPHITLAHPRNPRAPGNVASNVSSLPEVLEVTCPRVTLIEQERGGPWYVLETHELSGARA